MDNLDVWFSHIESLHQKRIDLGLDRVGRVAEILEVMQFDCPVITIAGTNGKGSTAKTLSSIYTQAGYKTALYTSPHLMHFNERICINENMISDKVLLDAFSAVEKVRGSIVLSFFEFITLAALYIFKQAHCDVVILEIGLGGRLDAVNIVESDLAILTSVAFDHMEFLGNTLDEIAYEKASIARANKPFLCAMTNPPSKVKETVLDKKGHYYQIGRDFDYDFQKYPKPRLKTENVAAAVFAVTLLQMRLPVPESVIMKGIEETHWPGRFECIEKPFSCVLDVAHNPESAGWLASQYAKLPKVRTIGVIGMLKDKQQIETIRPLLPYVDRWCVCDLSILEPARGSNGNTLINFLGAEGKNYTFFDSVDGAMKTLDCQEQGDRALIFGSFYTVMAAKAWLKDRNE